MMKRTFTFFTTLFLILALAGCGNQKQQEPSFPSESPQEPDQAATVSTESTSPEIAPPEEFILISGGTFQMGSPESEAWRVEDETAHTVTVSGYYISKFEVTQAEYQAIMADDGLPF